MKHKLSAKSFVRLGFVALALLFVSCEEPNAELVGPLWTLESVVPEGASAIKPDPTRTYTLQFFADSTYFGVGDCEDLFGQFWPENGIIARFGDGGVTRRGCDEATPSIEQYYPYGFFYSIRPSYEIDGTKLELHLEKRLPNGVNANLIFDTSD